MVPVTKVQSQCCGFNFTLATDLVQMQPTYDCACGNLNIIRQDGTTQDFAEYLKERNAASFLQTSAA